MTFKNFNCFFLQLGPLFDNCIIMASIEYKKTKRNVLVKHLDDIIIISFTILCLPITNWSFHEAQTHITRIPY